MHTTPLRLLWQQIPSTLITELLCDSTSNGIVLDLEHSYFDLETVFNCVQIISANRKLAFVRTPKTFTDHSRILDCGTDGLIFSTIETSNQCKELIDKCLYPPDGHRGLGLVRSNKWGSTQLTQHKPILVAQIETHRGVLNINEIRQHKFDYFLIGPYDLSLSMGIPGQFNDSEYLKNITILERQLGNKMGYHIVKDIETEIINKKQYNFLALGLDTLMIQEWIQRNKL